MPGLYFNAKGTWTSVTESENGSLTKGTPVSIDCQVVDDVRVEGGTGGREAGEGPWSVVVVALANAIKEGDLFQVTEVRGVAVTRKQRIVRSSSVVGGFSASHREVLI